MPANLLVTGATMVLLSLPLLVLLARGVTQERQRRAELREELLAAHAATSIQ